MFLIKIGMRERRPECRSGRDLVRLRSLLRHKGFTESKIGDCYTLEKIFENNHGRVLFTVSLKPVREVWQNSDTGSLCHEVCLKVGNRKALVETPHIERAEWEVSHPRNGLIHAVRTIINPQRHVEGIEKKIDEVVSSIPEKEKKPRKDHQAIA